MRKFLVLFLLLSGNLLAAQAILSNDEKKIESLMWGPDFNANFGNDEIKDAWKDYSAVILAKETRNSYKKVFLMNYLNNSRYFRMRIKIQREKALEEYGTLTLNKSFGYHHFFYGIKIVKPDGSEQKVDIAEVGKVVEVENRYRTRKEIKVAIPNLEIGDIIDYYEVRISEFPVGNFFAFEPDVYSFSQSYPICYQKISFDIQRKTYINLKSMNNAPSLKKSELEDSDLYFVEDRDRDPYETQPFMFPYRQLPYLKLKVTYASSGMSASLMDFLGHPSVPKSAISESELYKYLKERMEMGSSKGYGKIKKAYKNFGGDKNDQDTVFKMAFYKIRNLQNVQVSTYSSRNSMWQLARFLTEHGIENHFYLTVPRGFSTIDDVAFEEELVIGLSVKTDKRIYYIYDMERFDTPEPINSDICGSGALFWKRFSDFSEEKYRDTISIPSYHENGVVTTIDLQFDTASLKNNAMVSSSKQIKGNLKKQYQEYLMDYNDIINEEIAMFGTLKNAEEPARKSDKAERDQERHTKFEKWISEELNFEIDTLMPYTISQTGRFGEDFKFDYDLRTGDIVSATGPNYVLAIGKLIDKQVKLEEHQIKGREYDIFTSSPRFFSYIITFDIPDGFEVQGLDQLASNVENETGYFKAVSQNEKGKVKISVEKAYFHNYYPKEQWPLMVEFLKAADSFSQSKLLLRKQ